MQLKVSRFSYLTPVLWFTINRRHWRNRIQSGVSSNWNENEIAELKYHRWALYRRLQTFKISSRLLLPPPSGTLIVYQLVYHRVVGN